MAMRPWKLEIVRIESGQHWLRFVGGNGEIFQQRDIPDAIRSRAGSRQGREGVWGDGHSGDNRNDAGGG
jgi:hypothetical protein